MAELKDLRDAEIGYVQPVTNPGSTYYQNALKEEKLIGFLSQQFPTIANPAPLGNDP